MTMFRCSAYFSRANLLYFLTSRFVSFQPSATAPIPNIFHRLHKQWQKDRIALHPDSPLADYLKDEVAQRLIERILDIKQRYPKIIDLGSGSGHLVKFLEEDITSKVIMCDSSKPLLYRDQALDQERAISVERIVMDEETELMHHFSPDSLDIVVSNLAFHWINDLPGLLTQIRTCLKPDGVFIGAMLGGDTLFELRTSLQLAEQEREGKLSPRVSPLTMMPDVAGLLLRTGYNLTTVDMDEIVVEYPTPFELMQDLRLMGESNAIAARRSTLRKDTLIAASSIYQGLYGNTGKNTVPATFQVIFMIGWKPASTQPKPKPRGSAKVSLKEALEK